MNRDEAEQVASLTKLAAQAKRCVDDRKKVKMYQLVWKKWEQQCCWGAEC